MKMAAGHILNSSEVELEGQFRLDIDSTAKGLTGRKSTAVVAAQAHIVESHPQFVVIEITCSCGTKTSLKCEYADAKPSTDEQSNQTE